MGKMQYTTLGKTGWKVSKLGLGGAPLGGDYGETTDQEVIEVVHKALDLGINFVDTAPLYGRGESERRVGLALKGKRDQAILATKAVMRGDPYTYDNIILSVEQSLRRLQVDHIDLIQLHELETASVDTAINEIIPAFQKLKEQGKIRAIGVNARLIPLLLPIIEQDLVDTVQNFSRYNLIDFTAMDELLPLARKHQVAVINGSPLSMGILADAPAAFIKRDQPAYIEAKRRVDELDFLRKTEPRGLIEPAIRFSVTCPDIAVTLIGTAKVKNLEINASYCDGKGLAAEDMDKLLSMYQGKPIPW